jgi:tetratricopeptide (TPR) repeat protein
MLGELYERQGLFEKALEHYSLGIASVHQPYGSDYTDRGKMHFRLGHCAEARADFKEALRWRLTRPEWEEINSCLAEINTYL